MEEELKGKWTTQIRPVTKFSSNDYYRRKDKGQIEAFDNLSEYKPTYLPAGVMGYDGSNKTYRQLKTIKVRNSDGSFNYYMVPEFAVEGVYVDQPKSVVEPIPDLATQSNQAVVEPQRQPVQQQPTQKPATPKSTPVVKQPVPQNLSQKEEVKISPYADFDLNKAKELFASSRPQYNFSREIPPENSYSGNHTVHESFSFLPKGNFPVIELQVIDPNVSTFDGTKTDLKNGFLSPFNNKRYSYGIGNHKNILTNLRIYDPKTGEQRNYNISQDSELYKQFKFSENDPGNWLNAETYYNIVKNINNPSYFGEQYKPYRKIDKSKQLSKAGYPLRVNPYSQIDPNSDFYKNAGTYAKPESQKSWTELIYPKLDKGFGKIIGYITPEKIKKTTYIPGGRDNSSKRESNTQGDEIILPVHGNGGQLKYYKNGK